MPLPGRWHFWKQDLTADTPGKMGGFLRHGRCKLTQYVDHQCMHELSAEWALFWNTSTGVYYENDPAGDHEHSLHVAVWRVFSVWLHWTPPWKPRPDGARLFPRQIGVSAHDGVIFWRIWKDPMSWSRSDGWRNSSWNWKDWLLGKTEYDSEVLQEIETVVPMPEGNYPVRVTLTKDTWTRPHTLFGIGEHEIHRATIEPIADKDGKVKPIPVPGKGENAWDLDEDAIHSLTCQAMTVAEAIAAMVESAMKRRERYGGLQWSPT